ncbi:MAG: hypothetical protein PUD32_06230, partial [Bacteroidales bacterium]|nr:hypothetical protein [Bacteroidales bacterium]
LWPSGLTKSLVKIFIIGSVIILYGFSFQDSKYTLYKLVNLHTLSYPPELQEALHRQGREKAHDCQSILTNFFVDANIQHFSVYDT